MKEKWQSLEQPDITLDAENLKDELGQAPLFPEFDLDNMRLPMLDTPQDNDTRKLSLRDILEKARKAEDEFEEVEIDLEELGKDLRGKVDGIVEYIDRCIATSEKLKERADEFNAKATAFKNKAEGLKKWVAQQMIFDADLRFNEHGIRDEKPRISGNKFEIALKYSERVIIDKEPDAMIYSKESNKPFIRRYYEWNKNDLKKALKDNKEGLSKFAKIERVPQIKINPKG